MRFYSFHESLSMLWSRDQYSRAEQQISAISLLLKFTGAKLGCLMSALAAIVLSFVWRIRWRPKCDTHMVSYQLDDECRSKENAHDAILHHAGFNTAFSLVEVAHPISVTMLISWVIKSSFLRISSACWKRSVAKVVVVMMLYMPISYCMASLHQ